MKKKYILLKDSPELTKGAILREKCGDGTQDFECITMKKHGKYGTESRGVIYYRKVVTNSADWFAEVNLVYLTLEQIKKVKKFLKIK